MPAVAHAIAAADQVEIAVRLLLGSVNQLADRQTVQHFIANGPDLNSLRVLTVDGRVVWTILPIASAGRTGVLIEPNGPPPAALLPSVAELIAASCRALFDQNVRLIQCLLDPDDRSAESLHRSCGFASLAILEYLRLPAHQPAPMLPAGLALRTAPPDADLATALRASYVDTLDCPALNGLRSIDDVIAGYRHAHPYDPALWHVLYEAAQPVGVLLLSRPGPGEGVELSYLGIAPAIRGRAIGLALLRHACQTAAKLGSPELAVTADANNAPAKSLYLRVGGQIILRRRVMLRNFGG